MSPSPSATAAPAVAPVSIPTSWIVIGVIVAIVVVALAIVMAVLDHRAKMRREAERDQLTYHYKTQGEMDRDSDRLADKGFRIGHVSTTGSGESQRITVVYHRVDRTP